MRRARDRTTRRHRLAVTVVVVASALLSAGCVQLPERGPVVETRSEGNLNGDVGIYIDPKPPRSGDSAPDIVKGFLDAMTATPIQTNVAKQFLTQDAAASWDPELQTITYADASPPRGGSRVSVTLTGAEMLDARGAWLGPVPGVDDVLTFPMTLENGEVRIAEAPNALIVPKSWFEQRFRQVSLYFFDPTAQILVPEPVFVPRGEQLATTLIRSLLRGPGPGLGRVSRSFIPAGLTFGLSVPVSADGVADIALKGEAGQQTPQAIQLMLAQFAWALRQEPSIRAFQLSIGGVQLQLPGGQSQVSVTQGQEFDPTGVDASPLLFGLSEGKLVSGRPTELDRVDGPFGATAYGVDTMGVNLDATRVAAVSGNGSAVLLGPLLGPDTDVRQIVDDATRLLRPAWDFADRLWLVDRASRVGPGLLRVGRRGDVVAGPGVVGSQGEALPGLSGRVPAGRRGAPQRLGPDHGQQDPARRSGAGAACLQGPADRLGGRRKAGHPGHRLAQCHDGRGAALADRRALPGAIDLRRRVAARARQPLHHVARSGAGAGRLAGRLGHPLRHHPHQPDRPVELGPGQCPGPAEGVPVHLRRLIPPQPHPAAWRAARAGDGIAGCVPPFSTR